MSIFNFSGFQSPPKRPLIFPSPTSPFCTSPSQLQEVTLDQDVTFNNSLGARSPGGPMRGRSVKEFEEQLTSLKKENFNLKLRIYFLEERMGTNFNLDKENVVKKNVELMVEVESLRKELEEKHELLCQAVKAMELEEEEHKRASAEKEEVVAECTQAIESLKTQLLDVRAENETLSHRSYHSAVTDFSSNAFNLQTNAAESLHEKIRSLEEELRQEKENGAAIQLVLDQKDAKIRSLAARVDQLTLEMACKEQETKDLSHKVDEARSKHQAALQKLQDKNLVAEELGAENRQLRDKCLSARVELDRERKKWDKARAAADQKVAELQAKLEASLGELKKSQELVVSETAAGPGPHTDDDSFSVPQPATPPRPAQKNPLAVPAHLPTSLAPSPATPPTSPTPACPSAELFRSFEAALDRGGDVAALVGQLKSQSDAQQLKVVKLKAEQMKACKIIKSMIDSRNKANEDISALRQRIKELETELEGVVSKQAGGRSRPPEGAASAKRPDDEDSMSEQGQNTDLLDHYKALTDELEEKNQLLAATLIEKDSQMRKVQEQYEEILRNLKKKEDHIVDLEFELLSANQDKTSDRLSLGDKSISEIYLGQLQEKDEEIERLNGVLLKRTCDLQGLVNNELWDKNREIEKLYKRQASKIIEGKEEEIVRLQNEVSAKDVQLKMITEKIADLGIEIDLQRGGDETQVAQKNHLQMELEKSEKLRLEANEVCAVLSRRLEELAVFLDSLLRQKSVLGFLGSKENRKLRQIIDQSLDLSRSFTMSMLVNPDQSLMQLTNITSLLNDTSFEETSAILNMAPTNASLTFQSHLYKGDSAESNLIIEALRQQVINLKTELQLRDVELSKVSAPDLVGSKPSSGVALKYQDDQSESEAWSEPDRSVSRARIGLLDESLKSIGSAKKMASNVSSDSDSARLSKTPSKKSVLNESRHTIIELHKQVCDLDQQLGDKEAACAKLLDKLKDFEAKLEDTETKLAEAVDRKAEAEAKLAEADAERTEAAVKVGGLLKVVEELKAEKTDVAGGRNEEVEVRIRQVEEEKRQALSVAKEAEEAAEVAKNELKVAEAKLREAHDEMQDFEARVRREVETNARKEFEGVLTEKVRTLEGQYLKKMEEVQDIAVNEIKSLQDAIKQMRVECSANHAKKREVEAANEVVEQLKRQLTESERLIAESADRVKDLEEELAETQERLGRADDQLTETRDHLEHVQDQLVEAQENVNNLRHDLDNATLQYSEAVLDKTRLANEKASCLEREAAQQAELRRQLEEVAMSKQTCQKQAATLQQHKSRLEVRISELEQANAELHNRLVKIQAGCDHHVTCSTSLPAPATSFAAGFRRQHSENSGGYASEDNNFRSGIVVGSHHHRLVHNVVVGGADFERHEANSSPDLGIESDHGRFSSLETQMTVPRPLLQTLELTESMSNLLDAENNQVESVNCDNEHLCCRKTAEMTNENTDLKRKLLRTRRALEETVNQLAMANQRKKQVEKTICKQIHKTSQVLRKAKANLDSGSETDLNKKQ